MDRGPMWPDNNGWHGLTDKTGCGAASSGRELCRSEYQVWILFHVAGGQWRDLRRGGGDTHRRTGHGLIYREASLQMQGGGTHTYCWLLKRSEGSRGGEGRWVVWLAVD